jgi:hypothetical protein
MVFSLIPEKRLPTAFAAVALGAVSLQSKAWTEAVDRPVFSLPEGTTLLRADSIVTTDDEQALLGGGHGRVVRGGVAET